MAWWRKKTDDDLGNDEILDLDNIVWRGINQHDRLDRLAEAARHAEDEQSEVGQPLYPPKEYAPQTHDQKTVLPTDPLSTQNQPQSPLEDAEYPATHMGVSETLIEAEIRNQIIAGAMNAHQTIAKIHDTKPNLSPSDALNPEQSPAMSDAIRHIVADEIGSCMKDNIPRIIGETMAQASLPRSNNSAPSPAGKKATKAKKQSHQPSAKKVKAKTTPKRLAKTASKAKDKSAAKTKAKAAGKAKKSSPKTKS